MQNKKRMKLRISRLLMPYSIVITCYCSHTKVWSSMEPQCHIIVGCFTSSENKSGLLQGFSEVDGWRHLGGSMVSLITESWPGVPLYCPTTSAHTPGLDGSVTDLP